MGTLLAAFIMLRIVMAHSITPNIPYLRRSWAWMNPAALGDLMVTQSSDSSMLVALPGAITMTGTNELALAQEICCKAGSDVVAPWIT